MVLSSPFYPHDVLWGRLGWDRITGICVRVSLFHQANHCITLALTVLSPVLFCHNTSPVPFLSFQHCFSCRCRWMCFEPGPLWSKCVKMYQYWRQLHLPVPCGVSWRWASLFWWDSELKAAMVISWNLTLGMILPYNRGIFFKMSIFCIIGVWLRGTVFNRLILFFLLAC